MSQICPHCGVSLHGCASFCPRCAKSINERLEPKPPKPIPRNVLLICILLIAVAGAILGIHIYNRPLVLDGNGEVTYSDEDGKYQLLLGHGASRYEPIYEVANSAELDGDYRMPSRLYINLKDSGADANQIFLQKVKSVRTEFIQPEDRVSPMHCTAPAAAEYAPEAALISSITFTGRSGAAELLWTINMKNGDTILLRQKYIITPIETLDYYPADAAMDTIEELQALVDEIERNVASDAVVNIYLPPVTYEGGLAMEVRPVNLHGSIDGERRTTFTDTVRVAAQNQSIFYFNDIDFTGGGDGVGVSASARLHLINCAITGWKTGVLGYGYAWVNIAESRLEHNGIGFHFNSTGSSVSHTLYTGNHFLDNETAVLLENVPTNATINFGECLFSGNDKDIDNPCNQPINISEAVFK